MSNFLRRLWQQPVLLFLGAMACWAGNAVFTRFTLVSIEVGPIQLSFWRTLLAFMIISALAFPQIRHDWRVLWQHWPVLAFLGVTSLVAYNLFLYFGLASGEEAPAASTIASVFPIVIVGIGIVFFRERLTALGALGIVLAVCGGLVAAFEGSLQQALRFHLSTGKLWLVAAVLGYGTYMACVRLRPASIGPFSFLWALIFWALLCLSLLWLWDSLVRGNSFPWGQPLGLATLAYITIAPTLVAPILVNQAIKVGGAQTPGLMMNLLPFMVAALATFTGLLVPSFQESLLWYHWLSLALIIPGVLMIQSGR